MANKKRVRNFTVYASFEGVRERVFLSYLSSIFKPQDNFIINERATSGGSPNKILKDALSNCHFDNSFAWFDEDFEFQNPVSDDYKCRLAKCWSVSSEKHQDFMNCPLKDMQSKYNGKLRKPVLIVSQPVCVESLIILSLDGNPPYEVFDPNQRRAQISGLKDHFSNHILQGCDEAEHYKTNLTHELLEERRQNIVELNLLISMITK